MRGVYGAPRAHIASRTRSPRLARERELEGDQVRELFVGKRAFDEDGPAGRDRDERAVVDDSVDVEEREAQAPRERPVLAEDAISVCRFEVDDAHAPTIRSRIRSGWAAFISLARTVRSVERWITSTPSKRSMRSNRLANP